MGWFYDNGLMKLQIHAPAALAFHSPPSVDNIDRHAWMVKQACCMASLLNAMVLSGTCGNVRHILLALKSKKWQNIKKMPWSMCTQNHHDDNPGNHDLSDNVAP
jgi:hypothetical protein